MKARKKNKRIVKKNSRFTRFMARRGSHVVLVLAVMILLVSIVTLSFSWFQPGVRTGTGMSYQSNISMRSENCSMVTYVSNILEEGSNGAISYGDDPSTGAVSVAAPSSGTYSWVYFRTVITNGSEYPTNVSLAISQFPEEASPTEIGIGIASPSNTFRVYGGTNSRQSDMFIIRNAFVKGNTEEDHTATIDWFVRTKSAVSVDLNKLYILYN